MSTAPDRPPGFWRLAAFALPACVSQIVQGPVQGIVPTLYATHFGLSLAAIGGAMLFARVFDAVTDPVIGFLSDRTRTRLGRRKPWLIAGGALTMVSAWFLLDPPPHPSLAYFFVWYVLIFFAWTLCEIPHAAWAAEITRDYRGRTRVFTFRMILRFLGGLAFYLLPLLPIFATHAVTPETLKFLARVVLVGTPLIMAVAIAFGPGSLGDETAGAHYRLRDLVSIVRGNPPLWSYLAGFLLAGLAEGMFAALTFLYFTAALRIGDAFAGISVLLFAVAVVAMPMVPWLATRFGKHRLWAINNVMGVAAFLMVLALPSGKAAMLPMALLIIPIGFSNAIQNIVAPSLLGDVIDYDTLKSGKRREATYTSLYALVLKFNAAIGGSLAFFLLSLFGFDPKLGAANGPQAMLGLKMAYVVIPGLIFAASAAFIWRFPIDKRRQSVIARRLAQLDARVAGVEPSVMQADVAQALEAARG